MYYVYCYLLLQCKYLYHCYNGTSMCTQNVRENVVIYMHALASYNVCDCMVSSVIVTHVSDTHHWYSVSFCVIAS